MHEGPDDTFDFGARWGQLVTLSVLPAYREAGVGTAIMDEVDRQLAAIGATSVEIYVMQGNDRAREFYERRGYVPGQVYMFKVGSAGVSHEPRRARRQSHRSRALRRRRRVLHPEPRRLRPLLTDLAVTAPDDVSFHPRAHYVGIRHCEDETEDDAFWDGYNTATSSHWA